MEEEEKGDPPRPDHKNNNNINNNDNYTEKKMVEERQTQAQNRGASNLKAKSCKGCLYYSSSLKSKSSNPRCVGITRTVGNVPRPMVGQSEFEAFREGRNLSEFKYGCVGLSVYLDGKSSPQNPEEARPKLPACLGIELLMDKVAPSTEQSPPNVRSREDGHGYPWTSTPKPVNPEVSAYLTRFTRNAILVASGVARNTRIVGNYIKKNVEEALYRRPK